MIVIEINLQNQWFAIANGDEAFERRKSSLLVRILGRFEKRSATIQFQPIDRLKTTCLYKFNFSSISRAMKLFLRLITSSIATIKYLCKILFIIAEQSDPLRYVMVVFSTD